MPDETQPIDVFARLVRSRSSEHERAVRTLFGADTPGLLVSVLRQELDSLVRVLYLSQQSPDERDRLLLQFESGEMWTRRTLNGKAEKLTDQMMIEAASGLHGWAASVYRFGCSFIHLSRLHDHSTRDPLTLVSVEDRDAILGHMSFYHHSPIGPDVTFDELIPFLPRVFEKVRSNLESHLRDLERSGC